MYFIRYPPNTSGNVSVALKWSNNEVGSIGARREGGATGHPPSKREVAINTDLCGTSIHSYKCL